MEHRTRPFGQPITPVLKAGGLRRRHRYRAVFAGCLLILLMTGCVSRPLKTEKLRDLEFTVMDKEKVPAELKTAILENRDMPFKLTYADQGYLYIAEGYGPQQKSGYSVEVTGLYETENAVYIHTNLLGPEKGEKTQDVVTYPYVVVKLEFIDKNVVFD